MLIHPLKAEYCGQCILEVDVSLAHLQVRGHALPIERDCTNNAGPLGLQVVEESWGGILSVGVQLTSLFEQLCLLHQVDNGFHVNGEFPANLPCVDLEGCFIP